MQVKYWIDHKIHPFNSWALISISSIDGFSKGDLDQLEFLGCKKIITETFHDISSVVEFGNTDNTSGRIKNIMENSYDHPLILFNESKAKNIIKFIDCINILDIETLVVNCSAGVSRSGAVGLFACRYLKLNEYIFRNDNPSIFPNPFVLEVLNKESGLNNEYVKAWTTFDPVSADEIFL